MYPEKYEVGQRVILRGPLKCLKETLNDKVRAYTWYDKFNKYVGSEVDIVHSNNIFNSKHVTIRYRVYLKSLVQGKYILVYHHWLAPIEDNTFGFLYEEASICTLQNTK